MLSLLVNLESNLPKEERGKVVSVGWLVSWKMAEQLLSPSRRRYLEIRIFRYLCPSQCQKTVFFLVLGCLENLVILDSWQNI